MMSEMDITSIRGAAAAGSRVASHRAAAPSIDARSDDARSIDVTSLYHKAKLDRRDSDGVPAIPPLPDHTPFDFDIGFAGMQTPPPVPSSSARTTSMRTTSTTPFPVSSAHTSVVPDVERDPWGDNPGVLRSPSTSTLGRKVRRKPVPSEASFTSTSFGSEVHLLRNVSKDKDTPLSP